MERAKVRSGSPRRIREVHATVIVEECGERSRTSYSLGEQVGSKRMMASCDDCSFDARSDAVVGRYSQGGVRKYFYGI
jgi:hypothetical protein